MEAPMLHCMVAQSGQTLRYLKVSTGSPTHLQRMG